MKIENLIEIDEFCTSHEIELSFLSDLHQNGLIEITSIGQNRYISSRQLPQVEKFICFYYELNINIEGIESIAHMLERILCLKKEITTLRNQLLLFEPEE